MLKTRSVNRGAVLAVLLIGQFMANVDTAVGSSARKLIGAVTSAANPGRALSVVLCGFVALTLVGAGAAHRLVR